MKTNQHSFKRKIWLYDHADFDLYRESLEDCDCNLEELTVDECKNKITSYIMQSFIRPILEYADVVLDNCTQYEKNDLEKIQIEAAMIVTGATRSCSNA